MTDETPDPLLLRMMELKADIELLRYAVSFLCVAALPPAALDRLIEGLSTPVVADTPEATEAMYKAVDRFIDKLEKGRPVTKD